MLEYDDDEDDECVEDLQNRREYLVACIESRGINLSHGLGGKPLPLLSLQDLEDIYRISAREKKDESKWALETIWETMESEKAWFPFSVAAEVFSCNNCQCYNLTTTSSQAGNECFTCCAPIQVGSLVHTTSEDSQDSRRRQHLCFLV